MSKKRAVPVPGRLEAVLDAALDKALSVQRGAVTAYIDKVRRDDPHAPPGRVLEKLSSHYKRAVVTIGAAAGGTAAVPGVGTATAIASGAAEIAGFVEATSLFVLAVAEVYGVSVSDPERRRALVMAILLGEEAPLALEGAAVSAGPAWGAVLARTVPRETIGRVNKRLSRILINRYARKQGALFVGRALPFGIGVGIGALGNAKLADGVIHTARKAFGTPPARFGPRVIQA